MIDDKKRLYIIKKKLLLISALIVLLNVNHNNYNHIYNPSYEILEIQDDAFAKYSLGNIYIGNKNYLEGLTDLNENDILVLDERNSSDPNMKIYGSANIHDKNIRNEILEVLCRYEEMYPSRWDRSIESMRLEWLMHNISYQFKHETDRTTDVDLNNKDQDHYDNILLSKIFGL